jgi:hypothetical protein
VVAVVARMLLVVMHKMDRLVPVALEKLILEQHMQVAVAAVLHSI